MKFILDAGHGGMIAGKYQTAGKRSPVWGDGSQLFEGVFNRQIVNGIASELSKLGIDYQILVPGQKDINLSERVRMANAIHRVHGNTALVSVHSNAGGGTGFECFTYYGESKSDKFASLICDEFEKTFPSEKLRADYSDGDADKEANFYILRKTIMPAILTENFFMDTERDCRILMSEEGRKKIIHYHVEAIKKMAAL